MDATPLHLTCRYGRLAVCEMLIRKGADIEAKAKDNRTPLHYAFGTGNLAIAEMLISKGADLEALDHREMTPYEQYKQFAVLKVQHQTQTFATKGYTGERLAKRPRLKRTYRTSSGQTSSTEHSTEPQAMAGGGTTLAQSVEALDSTTSRAAWLTIIDEIFSVKETLPLDEFAALALKLVTKFESLSDYTAAECVRQMMKHVLPFVQSLCASDNLVDQPDLGQRDGVKLMLEKLETMRENLPALSTAAIESREKILTESAEAVKNAAKKVAKEQKRWAHLNKQHSDLETVLCVARRKEMQVRQDDIHTAGHVRKSLAAYRTTMQKAIQAMSQIPVKAMSTNQVHLLISRLGCQTVSLERIKEHAIDGQLLVGLTATEVMEMTGLQPLGLCHRIVYYAKKAADNAQPELLQLDYAQHVQKLGDWLQQLNDETGNEYLQHVNDQQVDIITIGTMSVRDLADLGVKPKDRRRMSELAIEASASVAHLPLTTTTYKHSLSVEHQHQLLAEKQALEQELAKVAEERDHMMQAQRDQEAREETLLAEQRRRLQELAEAQRRMSELEQLRRQQQEQLYCPITMQLMEDPVMAEDGHVYERDAIANWLEKKGTSPMTQAAMGDRLQPVLAIKQLIAQAKED
eukprot:TRINITY_DN11260_c0_g6_i1.p1 TRINITY_DN11260_c0_g6~~TRINITY_DN11260_c0_g6_i1.p1  ORF type:complete len:717 (+),score=119.59 TRINITY_DN11260_c0_g6_i1:254-2152(+)